MAHEPPQRSLLGLPIEGSLISSGEGAAKQRPIEELTPLLQAVLDDLGIEEFGWQQYTPYYNDGEVCTFQVRKVWFLLAEDADDEEDQKLREEDFEQWADEHRFNGIKGFQETVVTWEAHGKAGRAERVEVRNPRRDPQRHQRCGVLWQALRSEQFDLVLLGKFGDHAKVSINRDRILVEEYKHE